MENLINQILELEKKRINSLDWYNLTLKDLELIDDKEKIKEIKKNMNEFHMTFINNCSMLVGDDFQFSVPKDKLTYKIMSEDYMNYFYNKGMTKEQIIEMITNNKGKQK